MKAAASSGIAATIGVGSLRSRRHGPASRSGDGGLPRRKSNTNSRKEVARYHGLLEQKFVNACALDAKRNPMNANRAKFEQAKANLAVAQNHAGYATLVAPVTA